MRLTRIEAHELFSFERLQLDPLSDRTFVVGPNGSGKTNLLRILDVVRAAVERSASYSPEAHRTLARFTAARRFAAPSSKVSGARLGILLTEERERELMASFVRAALVSSLLRPSGSNADVPGVVAWANGIEPETLAALATGTIVVDMVEETTSQWHLGYEFEVDGELFRWVLEGMPSTGAIVRVADARSGVANYPAGQKLNLGANGVPQQPFVLSDVLPPPDEARALSIDAGPLPAPAPLLEFAASAGIPFEETQNRSYGFGYVLRVILAHGLILLSDLRQPPRLGYEAKEVGSQSLLTDGSVIPARLFRLKNGGPAERESYANVQELFNRLTGAHFEVTLSHRTSQRDDDSEPSLLISPVITEEGHDLAIEFAGAGLWEATLLSATLAESSGRVVMLDEPARNLHPTLQRRLVGEMRRADGQFVVTTHSPYMVPIEDDLDLAGIVRFDNRGGGTCANRLSQTGSESSRLRKALGESADARALLFARGVVLVEGGTEYGALPEWFAKSVTAAASGAPDVINVVVFSVDGDQSYGTFVQFLHGLGVPWGIVCDGSAFRFGAGKTQVFEQVMAAGVSVDDFETVVKATVAGVPPSFDEMRKVGAENGVFTLATDMQQPMESFEAFVECVLPDRLSEAAKLVGKSKVRQGRHVAVETACPAEVDSLYATLLQHLGVAAAGVPAAVRRAEAQRPRERTEKTWGV